MTRTKRPGKWRARIKARAVQAKARHDHGESIKQMWADSAAKIGHPEARRDGAARVPEALRVDRPEPEVLVEAGPSARAWFRQQQRDAATKRKHETNAARRKARAERMATPQPSRRQQILAARAEQESTR